MRNNIKDIDRVYKEFCNLICSINPKLIIPPVSLIVRLINNDPAVKGHYCNVLGLGEGGLNCVINNIKPEYYNTAKVLLFTDGLKHAFGKMLDVKIVTRDNSFEVYYKGEPKMVIDEVNNLLYIDKETLDNYYLCKDISTIEELKGVMFVPDKQEICDLTSIVKSCIVSELCVRKDSCVNEKSIQIGDNKFCDVMIDLRYATEESIDDQGILKINFKLSNISVNVISETGEILKNGTDYIFKEEEIRKQIERQ